MVNHILRNHLRANRASLKWAVQKSGQEATSKMNHYYGKKATSLR